ncbi:Swi3-domain-containing protein [Westerdykella ornata]|uniref:Chromosome segregation in meiosis protein n=1 Tax=Westerdykella ornata TaxID=318751 RepID=A0A6A6JU61_WESOR|nr:Swi3-domain-containing protein [Westerdykella ornata]KAF2280160.1 Swi3-domain-containing protein [Westerdykella ornata]
MAPANQTIRDVPSEDDLDAILNDTPDHDIFDTSNIKPQIQPPQESRPQPASADLGIDEEIKVVKKRRPIPKLDEERLLSDAGIPRLQRISKERLRFKGKGHEYGDIARMLNMYQLWLDDLYPRAKFADALTMIEALGHRKRIQISRKAWIDEGKPRPPVDSEDEDEGPGVRAVPAETTQLHPEWMEGIRLEDGNESVTEAQHIGEERTMAQTQSPSRTPHGADHPDDDELDALLAESETIDRSSATTRVRQDTAMHVDDPFADDMEAMAEMGELW